MPTLTIDHRVIEVPAGTKVIEAAEQLGIVIPRFCYHPALGSVGACRVCAVAFTDGPVKGVQMSCMINAQDEMVVSTTDDDAVDFRRHVIEWLMLNHPHDCPVCDEGGHCLLQDLTVAGGHGMRRYQGRKRTFVDQDLGPLVQHEMNRCIHCYRCARFYQEFAGGKDLGVMGIGAKVFFGRSRPGTLESPFTGNLTDLCPTGVYTDKPSRYIGRRWEFERAPSVCLHCSLGCNLTVSARYRRVVRHEARSNPDVNGYFICDRGRYGYAYNDSEERPRRAMAKGDERSMADALFDAGQKLEALVQYHGTQCVAVAGSVRSNLETLAVLDGLCREKRWADPVILHEARKAANLATAVAALEEDLAVSQGAVSVAENVLVIGADPLNEAPMLALALRQAQQQGGQVTVMDPRPVKMPMDCEHLPVPLSAMSAVIRHLIGAVCASTGAPADRASVGGLGLGESLLERQVEALTTGFCQCRRAVIICGTDITTDLEIGLAAELARSLRSAGTEAKLFFPLMGPNAYAAGRLMKDAGGIENLLGQIETGRIKALVLVENDLWRNCGDRPRLMRALDRLETFILLDYVASPLVDQADVFLPTQTLYEAGGQWINQEARLQVAEPVVAGGFSIELLGKGDHPPRVFEDAIAGATPAPAAALLSALAADMGQGEDRCGEFRAAALARVLSLLGDPRNGRRVSMVGESASPTPSADGQSAPAPDSAGDGIDLLVVDWTFGTDGLSSSSSTLAQVTPPPEARIHPETADRLGLTSSSRLTVTVEQGQLCAAWKADPGMAKSLVVIPRHHLLQWQELGATRLTLTTDQFGTDPA